MGRRIATIGFGALAIGTFVGLLTTLATSADSPNGDLRSYSLFAARDLNGRNFHVLSGNIGVNAGRMVFRGALDAPNSQVAADTLVFFGNPACRVGQLFANRPPSGPCGEAIPFTGSILPSNLEVAQACDFPPLVTCATDAAAQVRVDAGQSVVLKPGTYGNVVVLSHRGVVAGDLILQGGNYVFCSLLTGRGTRLLAAAPVTVQINAAATIGDSAFLGPQAGSKVSPADIRLYVSGQQASFRPRAEVHAFVCAPHASMRLNQAVSVEGTVVARSIGVADNVAVFLSGNGTSGSTTTTTFVVRTTTTSTSSRTTTTTTSASSTSSSSTSSTSTTLHPPATCGNGILEPGEACDGTDFGNTTCPGSTSGAFLRCVNCTQVDTSACPLVLRPEDCGNCQDDDGDGLVDFEDPDCCTRTHRFTMTLGATRLVPKTGGTVLRLRSLLARAGLASVDPRSQDVLFQMRPEGGRDIVCVRIPATRITRKGGRYRFRDRKATLDSARGVTVLTVRKPANGSVRFSARGQRVKVGSAQAGRLEVTVGFLNPSAAADNRCSQTTKLFRAGHNGALRSH
jgi:hypothetical protein